MLRAHFAPALAGEPGRLHFAAHSHHLWPDVTRDAVLECWDDAARLVDGKWDRILGEVVPRAQAHVARVLDLARPEQIAFAPNTHELVVLMGAIGEPGGVNPATRQDQPSIFLPPRKRVTKQVITSPLVDKSCSSVRTRSRGNCSALAISASSCSPCSFRYWRILSKTCLSDGVTCPDGFCRICPH